MEASNSGRKRYSGRRDSAIALAAFLALFAWPVREALFDPAKVLCASGGDELVEQGAYATQRFVIESWLRGDPPLWNRDLGAGLPCAGNPSCGVFDPQTLALAGLEKLGGRALSDWGLALFAWLRLSFAAWGAFLLARKLGLARAGALLAGASFGACGALALDLGASPGRVAWLAPWVLLALERTRDAGSRSAVAVAAAAFALALYGGDPQTALFLGLVASAWSLALLLRERDAGARAFVALGLGVLLAAPVVLPFLEYASRSSTLLARSSIPAPALDWLALGLLALLAGVVWRARELWPSADPRAQQRFALGAALVLALMLGVVAHLAGDASFASLLLVHDRFGAPGQDPQGWWGPGSYVDAASAWIPSATLTLALSACIAKCEPRLQRRACVVALAVLGLLLAMRAPGVRELWSYAPLAGLASTVRAAPIGALMLALLAGEAFECASSAARNAAAGTLAVLLGVLAVLPNASPAKPDVDLDPPDEIVGYVSLPPAVLSGGPIALEGWIDAGLDVDSVAVRVEPADEHTPPAHELPLPAQLASAPWTSGAVAPRAGAHWFRAQFLDVRDLAEGAWRFAVELRGHDGALLGERVAAASIVARPRSLRPLTIALAFAGLALAAFLRPRATRWGGPATFALCTGVLVQAFDFQRGLHPAVPRSECFAPTRTTSILARELGSRRYLSDAGVLPANAGLAHGLASLTGRDGLGVAAFDELRALALKPGVHPWLGWNASGADLDAPALRLLGVGAVVRDAPLAHRDWELIAAPDGSARETAETWIYRAREPLPSAFCVRELVDVERVRADPRAFDAQSSAIVEPGATAVLAHPFEHAEVSEPVFTNDSATLRASLDGDGVLVLTEQNFPGWHVAVDGVRKDLFNVDFGLRGVALGAGQHTLVFSYAPTSVNAGFVLAVVAVGALAWLAFKARASTRA